MTEEIAGFQTSPKAQVQAAFEEIARRSMHDLSFCILQCRCMFLIYAVRRSVDGVCDHPVDAECSYLPPARINSGRCAK